MHRVTQSELARRLGVDPSTISRAVAAGRVTVDADGLVDLAGATAQFETNRLRRRRRPRPPAAGPEAAGGAAVGAPGEAPVGVGPLDARARRDLAEASMAELREAELRRELVRRDAIERELAALLAGLRDGFDTLADRVAPIVAGEADAAACRRILRDEHRRVLAALVARVAGKPEPEGGA